MQKIELTRNQIEKLEAILGRYETFEQFSRTRKDAYEYVSIIGLRICPYCNIQFIYTVYELENERGPGGSHKSFVYRADLDHFETQTDSPDKALAQENLIPACLQCNQRVKFRTEFSKTTHLHPFYDDFDSLKRFSIDIRAADLLNENSFQIRLVDRAGLSPADCERANQTIKDLKLVSRYRYHRAEVVDLFRKARYYHRRKISEIESLTDTADLDRVLFSERFAEINETPLGKFKRDVLDVILRQSR